MQELKHNDHIATEKVARSAMKLFFAIPNDRQLASAQTQKI